MNSKTGSRIKQQRERRGWTQLELAEKVGMNNSVLSRIESNKRPVESEELKKFADVFNMSIDQLLGHVNGDLSNGAKAFKDAIDLSEDEAIKKIQDTFSYKGKQITVDQARMIYFLSLGVVKKD